MADRYQNVLSIPYKDFASEMKAVLAMSVGRDYAHYLANHEPFVLDVKTNVEETSAWHDEGFYTDDDIRLAIGRVLMDYLCVDYNK